MERPTPRAAGIRQLVERIEMINVLHIIDTGGPGGAETVFLNCVTGLDSAHFRSVGVVSREGWLAESLRKRGHQPLIEEASGSFNLSYLRRLVHIVRRERVDVIVAHLYGSTVYGALLALYTRVPMLAILHGQSDIHDSGRFAGVKRMLARSGSHRCVFVSKRLQDELAPALGLSQEQCVVIPNGVDLTRFSSERDDSLRRRLGLSDGMILVGAVGNIRAPKAYDVFLQAARLLKEKSPAYRFVIAGEGSGSLYDALLRQRSELGLEQEVTFLGLSSDVPRILRNFDVYALSSHTEGFSIACIEALASGVPVVATRSGGPEEILQDQECGLLVPVRHPVALAAAIDRVVQEPELAMRLRANGLTRVRERFALTSMLQEYERQLRLAAGRG